MSSWEEIKGKESGTILHDEHNEGVRFIVVRGPLSLCAYVGIPESHPLAGHDYDVIPIECHGGLTFSGKGDGYLPEGWYWYGWDYAHAGDRAFYADDMGFSEIVEEKRWVLKDVINDSWGALYDVKKLTKLAELINNKKPPSVN